MTDLTEQWKKGELPFGWYYIKIADIVFIDFFEGKVWKNKKDKYIDEVLAPVPIYEEWKEKLEENANLRAELKKACMRTIDFNIYNSQLKELLKEVLRHELSLKEVTELTRKIGEVLGE